jgi:hypothetical protein
VIDHWKISAITAISSFKTGDFVTPYSDQKFLEESKVEEAKVDDPLTQSLNQL